MPKYILAFWLCLLLGNAFAQKSISFSLKNQNTQEALVGVLAMVTGSTAGAVSDLQGLLVLENIPTGKISIRFSLMGYEAKTLSFEIPEMGQNPIVVFLQPQEQEMDVVTISSTRSSRSIEDIPTRVEFIAGEELEEKANMKPGDIRLLLSESTGIQVQITSPTSANAGIRIQGLDGRYTQILKDGFPLYSGAASGLGLLQIPPLDLKQVEVIKGSASTLYGGGAIAGLVNLISKTPETDGELSFLLNGTNAGGLDLSGFYGKRNDKTGTTIFGAYNTNSPYDPADIGLTAIPKFERFTFNPRIFLYPSERTKLNFGLNTTFEDRLGGNVAYIKNPEENPNGFFEENKTQRVSSQFFLDHKFDDRRHFQVKNSVNFFDRGLTSGDYRFKGLQQSTFSEISMGMDLEQMDWVLGGNIWTESFREEQFGSASLRDYDLNTFGLFLQNTWKTSAKTTLETGLRTDYVGNYGWAILPKAALLYRVSPKATSRIGGGLGYKAPTIFTEESERIQYRNVLPIDPNTNRLEKSYGLNWDVNYKTGLFDDQLFLSINHLFFYTYLDNPLFLEEVQAGFRFVNIEGSSESKGTETNVKLEYQDFKLFLGYTFTDARLRQNGTTRPNPLTPKHRVNTVLFYEVEEEWKVGLEGYYFSEQKLSDGTIGRDYWIVGLMAEKIWEKFSLYINFENFLDARQTRFDSIFTGNLDNPNFRDIYAPLDGFVINGGVKLRLM
ncbi:TonB-dependent receptor domain-containing protein [Rhodonellum sp.]|uniref:TonB-dependent receptor n=1 Tax=Rhodonellum sp. TaxID=2231180 RepID=UPI002724E6BC|nr:TonB-dependent receptor [Rhodonellum sp.]MDO9552561.1 TonB-dependent receptor [Rhodonellum sp.]